MFKNWKKRWYQLTASGTLTYMEAKGHSPIDTIPLRGATIGPPHRARAGYPHAFRLNLEVKSSSSLNREKNKFILSGEDHDDSCAWQEAILLSYPLLPSSRVIKIEVEYAFDSTKVKSGPPTAQCIFAYAAQFKGDLELQEGDVVTVLKESDDGWWDGELGGRRGRFPGNFVQKLDDLLEGSVSEGASTSSLSTLSSSPRSSPTPHSPRRCAVGPGGEAPDCSWSRRGSCAYQRAFHTP